MKPALVTWCSSERAILCGALAATLVTRLPTRSEYLFSWDAVNFALALDRWDLSLHQPHPPGYVGYVGLGRLIGSTGLDHNTSLQLASILASALASCVLWRLAQRVGLSPTRSAFCAALLLSSPLVWLYSSVAEVYALDLLAVVTVVATTMTSSQDTAGTRARLSIAYACAALVKLPTAILLLPVALVGSQHRWPRLLCGVAGVLAVVTGFALLEHDFVAVTWDQLLSATGGTTVIGADPGEMVNRNVRDLFRAVVMAGAGLVVLMPYAVTRLRGTNNLHGPLALAWAGPMLAVFVLLHFGKPGYFIPLVPLLCLYVAAGVPVGRNGTALLTAAVAANVIQFSCVAPFDARLMGEGKHYADKTLMEKAATELSPIAFASRVTLEQEDQRVARVLAAATFDCSGRRVIVVSNGGALDWRRTMFYLPQHTVVRFDEPGTELLVADAHRVHALTDSEQLTSECAILWLDDEAPVTGNRLVVAGDQASTWLVDPPLAIDIGEDRRLTILR